MSDIKKTLILSAKLDTQGITTELKKLKKEFSSGVEIDKSTFASFKQEFQKIAQDFSKSLKEALKGITVPRIENSMSPSSMRRNARANGSQNGPRIPSYSTYKPHIDPGTFQNNTDSSQSEAKKKRQSKKQIQEEEKLRMNSLQKWGEKFLGYMKTGGTFMQGVGRAGSSRSFSGTASGIGAAARTAGAAGIGAAGLAAGVVGGGIALGGAIVAGNLRYSERGRETRTALADKEFEAARGVTSGDVYGTQIRQSRRKSGLSGLNRFSAGVRGVVGDLSSFRLGDALSGVGAKASIANEERSEGDASIAQTGPLVDAIQNSVIPRMKSRVSALQGGSLTSEALNSLVGKGGGFGFSQDEVLDQMNSVKSSLGNSQMTGSNMGLMMENTRRYGTSSGLQGQAGDALRSFSGDGMSAGQGLRAQSDQIKRGVAAGLDASKTSRFLEATSDYVTSSGGLGSLDINEITRNLAGLTQGFASASGRSESTVSDIDRARQAQSIFKQESTSTSGISGIGNIASILDSAREAGVDLSVGEFMSLQNTSSEAGAGSILETLSGNKASGSSKNKMAGLLGNRKNNAFGYGSGILGLDPAMATGLRSGELGQTTESTQGLFKANAMRGAGNVGVDTQGALGSGELTNLANQATVDFTNFTAGFKELGTVNSLYADQVRKLTESLELASTRASAMFTEAGVRRTPNAAKPAHNQTFEDAARSVRGMGSK